MLKNKPQNVIATLRLDISNSKLSLICNAILSVLTVHSPLFRVTYTQDFGDLYFGKFSHDFTNKILVHIFIYL